MHLDPEAEAGRRLLRPAPEHVLGGQAVEDADELDGRQALRVVAQEVGRPGVGRVEASSPGRVGEAGDSGVQATSHDHTLWTTLL